MISLPPEENVIRAYLLRLMNLLIIDSRIISASSFSTSIRSVEWSSYNSSMSIVSFSFSVRLDSPFGRVHI